MFRGLRDNIASHVKRLIAILLFVSHALAGTETSVHWRDLGPIVAGKDIIVVLADGKRVKGHGASIEADSLLIDTHAQRRQPVPRNMVREIRMARSAGYKWRLIGTALGAGIGIAIAVPVLAETHNEGSGRYDGAAIGLAGGLAALGYLAGWSADRRGDVLRVLPD